MRETFIITFLLLTITICSGQTKESKETEQKIDTYIQDVIAINEIPGAALAVIKDGKIIYEKYYGKASLEENKAVDKNTIFKIFSTSKLITNVGVFQLIENGKLALEDPISKYLENLPKEWQAIKVENLLTHSSGLPDIIKFNDIPITLSYKERIDLLATKPMDFVTGNEYRYNQTNYLFLAKIIEKISGLTFDQYILQDQFSDVKSGLYLSSNFAEIFSNTAVRYNFNRETNSYQKSFFDSGIDSHSSNGINISLHEFIRWNQNLDNNTYLKSETKNAMWKPFEFKTKYDFGYGWGIYPVNNILSYGFSGGNETAFRKFTKNNLTVIFLSNGHKYSGVQDQVVNHVAGIVDKTLFDEYAITDEKITFDFLKLDIKKAEENYVAIKKKHPNWNFEDRLNTTGYALMSSKRVNDAIKVFELNTKENPQSGNAFDSLAESYFYNNQFEISRLNYKKSLELAPDNNNAKEMLKKIDMKLSK
ncbi:serine hydrolase [Flavobacterium sp. ANB]|uniref:serine hydrolase domain-containing protein n=1 Tax=unclassified Flavobacterium TaxID=196869 RepID=UPI0012B70CFF|nr:MULTISPECIES: serine hydrolase domain-containing protein [unclassified Flavobacterium]MBF4516041.1 serine hydrolase [Flavobacterium sp. ANB]MTD69043.1 serine hydrolase [Flavobacterium sp. LC2016-13]